MVLDGFLLRAIAAAAVISVSVAVSGYLRAVLERFLAKFGKGFAAKVSEGVRYLIIIFGAVIAFSVLSFDVMVVAIILGGLFIVILVGLRDVFLNLAAEAYLRVRKPFDEGDWIKVGDFEGRVKLIGSFDTELVTAEGERVIVPNAFFLNHPITNKSQTTATYIDIRLTFSNITLSRLEETLKDALEEIRPELLGEPEILSINEKGGKAEVIISLPVVNPRKLRWLISRLSKAFHGQGIEVEIE